MDAAADLHFYLDPVCPFAWLTSKWVRTREEHGRAAVGRLYAAYGEHVRRSPTPVC